MEVWKIIFLVPLIGGKYHISIPPLAGTIPLIYHFLSLPIVGDYIYIYHQAHLLREPSKQLLNRVGSTFSPTSLQVSVKVEDLIGPSEAPMVGRAFLVVGHGVGSPQRFKGQLGVPLAVYPWYLYVFIVFSEILGDYNP